MLDDVVTKDMLDVGDEELDADGVPYVVLSDVMDNALDDVMMEDEDVDADDVPKEVIDYAMDDVRDGQEADEMLHDVVAKEMK